MFYIPERAKYFEIFQKANIPVTYTGSINKNIYPAQVLQMDDYVNVFKRTKISLAYTESIFGPNNKTRKLRPFDCAACGSFMLSTHPEAYKFRNKYWFEEGVHYDSMNESNCVDKVRYYLANPEKRIAIAKANGIYKGRRVGSSTSTLDFLNKPKNKKAIERLKSGYKKSEVAKITGLHINTITKISKVLDKIKV
jgi:hypothetical protein